MKHSDRLLLFLKDSTPSYVSGEKISKELGITRSMVWKEIKELKKLGYKIKASSRLGYQFVSSPDKLFADEIQYKLGAKWMGKRIFSYQELDSTNNAAMRLGSEGLAAGTCVFAEYQKKGRGRLGRVWVSPRGKNILFSTILRPELNSSEVSRLTLMSALAVIKSIESQTGVKLQVKWPNDVVYKGKKVCGILTEMSGESERVGFVVVGIGINVNTTARELPPQSASLRQIAGKKISRIALAQNLLREIENCYERFSKKKFERVADEWENVSETTGSRVAVHMPGRVLEGLAAGVDPDGALWVRHDSGLRERVLSGDVQKLRPGLIKGLKK